MAYRGSWPLTVKGHSGSRVYALQYLLKYRGYSPGTVDGKFGTNTYNAARNFQRSRGLVVDGKVGTNTWSKLIATFRKGSSNNAVRAIQYLLRYRYGYTAVGNVDGIYGTKTYDCAYYFQRKCGITRDGIVGTNTWKYLLGSDAMPSFSANATGMAQYASYRVKDNIVTFADDTNIRAGSWCAPFIKYCASKVGYNRTLSYLTNEQRGLIPTTTSGIRKGNTVFINAGGGHYGIVWSFSSSRLTTIEANSDYIGPSGGPNNRDVQYVYYYWDYTRKRFQRDDRVSNRYIVKYMVNS